MIKKFYLKVMLNIFLLFCLKSKKEHFWNKEVFLFHFKTFFRSWDIQSLEIKNLKYS